MPLFVDCFHASILFGLFFDPDDGDVPAKCHMTFNGQHSRKPQIINNRFHENI
jgi:hypothetical protein